MTSTFEWSLITGQRRFRWPLVSHALNNFVIPVLITTQSACQFDRPFWNCDSGLTNDSFLLPFTLLHAAFLHRPVSVDSTSEGSQQPHAIV
jgi:hypothetical protein